MVEQRFQRLHILTSLSSIPRISCIYSMKVFYVMQWNFSFSISSTIDIYSSWSQRSNQQFWLWLFRVERLTCSNKGCWPRYESYQNNIVWFIYLPKYYCLGHLSGVGAYDLKANILTLKIWPVTKKFQESPTLPAQTPKYGECNILANWWGKCWLLSDGVWWYYIWKRKSLTWTWSGICVTYHNKVLWIA